MGLSFRRNCKGQVLVVSGLLVALILLSTALYVIEVSKNVPKVEDKYAFSFESYIPSIKNTVISALANASNGGSLEILEEDLSQLRTVMLSHSYSALLTMDYTLPTDDDYQNGICLNWNDDSGISSAYAACTLQAQASTAQSSVTYSFNVTSQLTISGDYNQENETQKQVTLVVSVLNEGESALAQSFVFSYYNGTDWATVDSPIVLDYGDGSYAVSFLTSQCSA